MFRAAVTGYVRQGRPVPDDLHAQLEAALNGWLAGLGRQRVTALARFSCARAAVDSEPSALSHGRYHGMCRSFGVRRPASVVCRGVALKGHTLPATCPLPVFGATDLFGLDARGGVGEVVLSELKQKLAITRVRLDPTLILGLQFSDRGLARRCGHRPADPWVTGLPFPVRELLDLRFQTHPEYGSVLGFHRHQLLYEEVFNRAIVVIDNAHCGVDIVPMERHATNGHGMGWRIPDNSCCENQQRAEKHRADECRDAHVNHGRMQETRRQPYR